jgi:hypothetical protein
MGAAEADHRGDERKAEPRQLAPHREGGVAWPGRQDVIIRETTQVM